MKSIKLISLLLLSIFLMQSCTNDDSFNSGKENDTVAPELPPMQSFIMPFTGFEDADTTGIIEQSNNRSVGTYRNWFYAATNLVIWHTAVTVNMALPLASFAEAFNHDPVYAGNGIWKWSYDVNDNGNVFLCVLSGQFISDEEIQFDMHVSKAGGFNSVHWYQGNITDNGDTGIWVFNDQPNNPRKVLQLEYGTNDTGVGMIRFTNINNQSTDLGDYIEYREAPGATYDRAYDVFKTKNDNLLEIQWKESFDYGRVKSPIFYNDSDWHCWDEEYMDTDCD